VYGIGTETGRNINGMELKTHKWTHTPMVTWSLTKKIKPSGGKKTAFSTNGAGSNGGQHANLSILIYLYKVQV
jgi:hypothetical protein